MKKLQIFVSSTYLDLKEERQAAVEAILKAGHIPAGMELFAAGDTSQWETIKRWIDESDVFLLIVGGRYGSIEPVSSLSYTEAEYDYAVVRAKKFFAVVITEDALDKKIKALGIDAIEIDNPHKLKRFRKKVLCKTSTFFSDAKDIKIAINDSIRDFVARHEFKGWIPGDTIPDSILTFDEFYKGFQYAIDKHPHATSLDVYALSTDRFVRQVADRPTLRIERVRVILPSEAAINTFYSQSKGPLVADTALAVKSIKDQLRGAATIWHNLETIKKVGVVELNHIDTFPMFYLGVIDRQTCFYGYFYMDKTDLVNGITMGPTYVLQGIDKVVQIHVNWFDSLWQILAAK